MWTRSRPIATLAAVAIALATPLSTSAQPVPPCIAPQVPPVPAWSEAAAAPNLGVWHEVALDLGASCPRALDGPAELVVALATRFRHEGGVAELAERVGAISALEGLPYWSVSDGRWRPLISVSHAIASAGETDPRPDFSAAEVLSGRTLYTAQRDTRSHGLNIHALQATSPS